MTANHSTLFFFLILSTPRFVTVIAKCLGLGLDIVFLSRVDIIAALRASVFLHDCQLMYCYYCRGASSEHEHAVMSEKVGCRD